MYESRKHHRRQFTWNSMCREPYHETATRCGLFAKISRKARGLHCVERESLLVLVRLRTDRCRLLLIAFVRPLRQRCCILEVSERAREVQALAGAASLDHRHTTVASCCWNHTEARKSSRCVLQMHLKRATVLDVEAARQPEGCVRCCRFHRRL